MTKSASPPSLSRFFLGLCIVGVGVLFTLQNLGWSGAERIFEWLSDHWPVVFVLIGLGKLVGERRSWLGALIWIGAGLTLLAPKPIRNDILDLVFRFWPLGLVLLGLAVVSKALRGGEKSATKKDGALRDETGEAFDTSPRVGLFALLSTRKVRSASTDFTGGDLSACLGSCELDLTRAELSGKAVIDVFAFWGGIEIVVPETWSVEMRVNPLMGGAEDSTLPPKVPTGEHLVVRGMAFMGGVDVRN